MLFEKSMIVNKIKSNTLHKRSDLKSQKYHRKTTFGI